MYFKLRQLEGFVAAARHPTFSEAAATLSLTQPAFSQLIRELEQSLGSRLFERTTRRVTLTDAGRRLLGMVERPLEDLRAAHSHALDIASGRRGRIAFAALPSAAFGFAPSALAQFKARYPDTTVRLVEEQNLNIIEAVMNREVDFGISTMSTPHPELEFEPIAWDELVTVMPAKHALSRSATLNWGMLAAEPLVLLPRKSSVRELAEQGFAACGLTLEATYEVANMVTALAMVREGLGLTILPHMALAGLSMRRLVSRRLKKPMPRREIGLLRRRDRPLSPVAQACADLLRAAAQRTSYNAGDGERPGRKRSTTPAAR